MVMRNGNDGADAHRWWDDLPPRVRTRISHPPAPAAQPSDAPPPESALAPSRSLFAPGELARDLSRLAVLFFVIAIANMLFLLLALSFLYSH
ncbi:MAG TPA: hypothetical protein VGE74_21420 [Gemmata sp.]